MTSTNPGSKGFADAPGANLFVESPPTTASVEVPSPGAWLGVRMAVIAMVTAMAVYGCNHLLFETALAW